MKNAVLISGATKGIGRETVLALAKADLEFDCIVMVGRDAARIEETRRKAESVARGKSVVGIVADLENPEVAEDIFDKLAEEGVSLTAIINNAGFTKPASINETRLEDFELTMRVNVYSPFRIVQTALRRNHPLAKILNVASTAGMNGRAGWLSYSASKAAMINMSEVMREELKMYGIDVMCISPGRCATDLRKQLAPDEDPSTIMQPSQVADVIELLMSPTGLLLHSQNLVVRT
ncbi:MAG: short-chain dehydrogenase [Rhodobacterales bacterium]|nr:MAG: short-chain dehydrogenase [Rhodobacterales bacterium]